MEKYISKVHFFLKTQWVQKTIKIGKIFLIALLSILLVSALGMRIYFESNKEEIVAKINTQINENILGQAKIGRIGYRFLVGFPNVTLVLNEVSLRDSLYAIHQRPVLQAKEIEVRLNVLKLLKKEVSIHKVVIIDAKIDLYKDKNGVSNSNVFMPKKKKPKSESTTTAFVDAVFLKNVNFISENELGHKSFNFLIHSLKSTINYSDEGWETELKLSALANSMAFNIKQGSFIKNKDLEGELRVVFSKEQNQIKVNTENLKIGDDVFKIKSNFNLAKGNALFDIDIRTQIKWSNAYNLLSNNISSKLNKFDLKIPLAVSCVIKGDMNEKGDPEIVVHAKIINDVLTTSYGAVEKCSFNGKFTNNYTTGLGCNDPNSAVIITDFKGELNKMAIAIPSAIINDLEKPVATGVFHSEYDVVNLGSLINPNFIKFIEGTAKVDLNFKVDIVDLRLNKPHFTGDISFKDISFFYKQKNVTFQKTDIDLHFTEEALLIKKIKFQNKANTVFMEGRVDNFLNLYYDDPENMVVNWEIYSPYLDIKQFIRLLTYHDKAIAVKKKVKKKSSIAFDEVLDKSQVNLNLKVDKMAFNTMVGNNFKVNVKAGKKGVFVNNGSVRSLQGGVMNFDGQLVPTANNFLLFKVNLNLKNGDISNFLAAFNNFRVKSFGPNDIDGKLCLTTSLGGTLDAERELVENSVNGNLKFDIKNGIFKNFKPLIKIGKIAFPNRDMNRITFSDLYAITTVNKGNVYVDELKVTSNVLNFDVKGIYSLSNFGTDLGVRIPLRNPEEDYKIADLKEREAKRYKGIVVNLHVVDDKKGGTKVKLGKIKEEPKPDEIK